MSGAPLCPDAVTPCRRDRIPTGYAGDGILILNLHEIVTEKKDIELWVDETVALCRERLAFLFNLSANERAFLDGILERGEINAHLLDVDPDIQTRIGAMPMLAWKTLHVRRHRGLSVTPDIA